MKYNTNEIVLTEFFKFIYIDITRKINPSSHLQTRRAFTWHFSRRMIVHLTGSGVADH